MTKTKKAIKYSLISAIIFLVAEFGINYVWGYFEPGEIVFSSFLIALIAFIGMIWGK